MIYEIEIYKFDHCVIATQLKNAWMDEGLSHIINVGLARK